MAYLVASAERREPGAIQKSSPETWRRVRRYNRPVQLALAAAEEVMRSSKDPAAAAVISLAPCQPGSADLYRWGEVVTAGMASGSLGDLRMNPTQTLHAVDNLAMSAFAITYGNHADCLGLGGAAGQAWAGLEAALERLNVDASDEMEALVMAGDQDTHDESGSGLGVALLFSTKARRYEATAHFVRLVRIEKTALTSAVAPQPHAAAGLSTFITFIKQQRPGLVSYDVPGEHTDGVSAVKLIVESSL
jgi:hypothetical protein